MSEQQNDFLQDERECKGKTLDNLFAEAFDVNVPKLTFPLRRHLFFCCSSANLQT